MDAHARLKGKRSLELVSFPSYSVASGLKKPPLLGYTAKDGQNLDYIIKDNSGHTTDKLSLGRC